MYKHFSVLNEETVAGVLNDLSGIYVDGTLGGAGHTKNLLTKLDPEAQVFGFDQDITAIENAQKIITNNNFLAVHDNFQNLKQQLHKYNIKKINGLILDLGFSSVQIDNAERGFSYMQNGPLDMRMNKDSKKTAYQIINEYSRGELIKILKIYGEEKNAGFIAEGIIKLREIKEIKTTFELVEVIENSIPLKIKQQIKGHVAKKTFQALRIEVNAELNVLKKVLEDAYEMLLPNGRLSIITFHSLEDKIVKYFYKEKSELPLELKELPYVPETYQPKAKIITKKPIIPSIEEIKKNSRSKSAKLRILEKI